MEFRASADVCPALETAPLDRKSQVPSGALPASTRAQDRSHGPQTWTPSGLEFATGPPVWVLGRDRGGGRNRAPRHVCLQSRGQDQDAPRSMPRSQPLGDAQRSLDSRKDGQGPSLKPRSQPLVRRVTMAGGPHDRLPAGTHAHSCRSHRGVPHQHRQPEAAIRLRRTLPERQG